MKLLWATACFLAGMDMMLIAIGVKPSTLVTPDWQWLAWFPTIGWFCAAYSAAVARADWV